MIDLSKAEKWHRKAWEALIKQATSDPYAKYAIYASRTLAVSHPEVYLIGDRWFYEGAHFIKGFGECYREPSSLAWRHMEYGRKFFRAGRDYTGVPNGRPFSFSEVRLDKYRPAPVHRLYPDPLISLVDHRLLPLAVSLKAEGRVVTPLELAEMYYFAAIEGGVDPDGLFLILCADESAYLWDGNALFSPETNGQVSQVSAPPVLIFNEKAVWHPTMGRDDRELSAKLDEVVTRLGPVPEPPTLTSAEDLVDGLRSASSLDNEEQRQLAALAAVRAVGWEFHPYFESWTRFVPEKDFQIDISRRLGFIREFNRLANSVSPATAFLAAVASSASSLEIQMRTLSYEYLLHTGIVREAEARGWKKAWRLEAWGHVWPCGLMEHTIDDAFRTRTGHCVSQAHMIGAVLEMLEVPHIVVNFDRGGVSEGVNHHFVLSLDGQFLIDDGIVNFKTMDPPTEDYGPLLSFSAQGEWARTVGDSLFGNIPSTRIAELVEEIEKALAGRFELRFFAKEGEKETLSKAEFLELLARQEVERCSLP